MEKPEPFEVGENDDNGNPYWAYPVPEMDAYLAGFEADNVKAWTAVERLTGELLYIGGIVARGENRALSDGESVESAILGYVKSLEAQVERMRDGFVAISKADYHLWPVEQSSAEEFVEWAQSIARAALADSPQAGSVEAGPEVGDVCISVTSHAATHGGRPDLFYWDEYQKNAMEDETILVIMRRAEVEQRIKEAGN